MKKIKRLKDEFRLKAGEARSRLKSGYWTAVKSEREAEISKAESEGRDAERIKEYYRNKFEQDFIKKDIIDDEEAFYNKVVDILNSDELITNPIARLIDEKLFDSMDTASRQRYVLTVSDKYQKMCERYNRERKLQGYLVH
jgi:hypothetical protein